eukprot:448534-Amphidinium_carterae.1
MGRRLDDRAPRLGWGSWCAVAKRDLTLKDGTGNCEMDEILAFFAAFITGTDRPGGVGVLLTGRECSCAVSLTGFR